MPREVHTQVDTRQVYQPISAPQAQQVYQQEAVVQKVESNALAKLDNYIRPFAENGEPIPDEGIDQLRGDLGKFFGVTNKRYNDLLFSALDKLGKEGNYSVYDSLKKAKA